MRKDYSLRALLGQMADGGAYRTYQGEYETIRKLLKRLESKEAPYLDMEAVVNFDDDGNPAIYLDHPNHPDHERPFDYLFCNYVWKKPKGGK